MSDLRTAAQQALEFAADIVRGKYKGNAEEIRDALRAALELPEQEPVAWMVYTEDGKSAYVTDNPHDLVGAYKAFALYAHPPRRKWRGLKEWEINDGLDQLPTEDVCSWSFREGVYFAEAALKERNHE